MAKSQTPKPTDPPPPKIPSPSPSPAASKSSSPEPLAQPTPQPEAPKEAAPKDKQQQPPPKESFESYYLKRVTAEFADDIDKIRNASDFNERSVPVLIQALKQGAVGFSQEERERIMGAKP